ncbi:hypothetical protein IV203_012783 [Nitzschia inconspicua]|uniref:Uncharacterized protein n=1 Tax=Nitzschia inconspicua TaxID=303405 RepID=A0A9K3P947_9STRA|nr:hypothetical protein IV203_012767 [Nitzschia inconspicua]KAG7350050.1 hypothetical protein IV203_012647 [Nitzschia inconspicua]KAG7373688.1 hypothetical protein IV203_012783 [Nitzschia inconspicua]
MAQRQRSGMHQLDVAATAIESSFLVSDDEGDDDDDDDGYFVKLRNEVGKDDYSPIPVRSITATQDVLYNDNNQTAPSESRLESSSDNRVGVLLPARGTDLWKARAPHASEFGGRFSLQPRNNTIRHATGHRFALQDAHQKKAQDEQDAAFLSNLQTSESLKSWRTHGHESASDHHHVSSKQRNDGHSFPSPQTDKSHNSLPATAATATQALEALSSCRRVTFSQPAAQTAMESSSSSFSSRPLSRRPLARSQSIAIQKRGRHALSLSTSDQEEPSFLQDSYNERLYDSATWRMYHRIIDHRRTQLQHRQQEDHMVVEDRGATTTANEFSTQSNVHRHGHFHKPSQTNGGMMLFSSHCHQYQHDSFYNPRNGSSSASSITSTQTEEDEIFEMEL